MPEHYFPIARAIEDRTGYRPAPATISRWIHLGLLDSNGQRIRLRVRRLGRHLSTSHENVDRFVAALNNEAHRPEEAAAELSAGEYLDNEFGKDS